MFEVTLLLSHPWTHNADLAMKPLFLGSHPAMDILNTSLSPRGQAIELIGDGQSFVAWLVSAGLPGASTASKRKRRFRAEALDAVAAEARRLRDWAGDWISRWRDAPGRRLSDGASPPEPPT
jgi:Putative stress-induced transcription regulator